jgi:gamma-glutamyltranspeptidase / glutathione hydrolase
MPLPVESWRICKPTAFARRGVVAAQNGRAAEVGAAILRQGGNAIDAAIATGFALGVTEPWMSGIGGGGLMLIKPAGQDRVVAVDATMVAARNLDPADYPLSGGAAASIFNWPAVVDDRNMTGATSVCVPGLVDGYRIASERFGKLRWAELVEPARALAAEGLLIDWYATLCIAVDAARLRGFAESSARFLADGLPPVPSVTPQPTFRDWGALPKTLATIRDNGARALYEGPLAVAMARDVQAAGGPLAADDLADYQAQWTPPGEQPYRGATVYTCSGLTGGPTLARALSELEQRRIGGERPAADDYLAYADALSAAFAHRLERMGASGGESSTSHLTVADAEGNVVALTQTLLARFGSALVLPETGILMNNGMLWFDPRPGQVNSIAPGKRPLANMCPIICIASDGAVSGCGACGGRRIIGAVLQVLSFMEDFAMDPAAALLQPRIDVSGGPTVLVDDRLPDEVFERLAGRHAPERLASGVYPDSYAVPNVARYDPNAPPDAPLSAAAHPYSPWTRVATA